MVIRSISVMSVAKIFGALYGLLGLIGGAVVSLIAMVGGMAAMQSEMGAQGGAAGMLFGVGAIIVFPLLYGGLGFVFGAISTFIYNIVAGIVGGIRIEVQ